MQLRFLGAAGAVTGSCYLVDTGEVKFLIDCGMFQGGAEAERKNRRFAFEPREIAFVLLSHAHIDHSGLIPRLAARGFTGPVYATQATAELLGIMLPDSGHLQERDAEREGRAPLYSAEEAKRSLALLRAVEYGAAFEPQPGVRCLYRDAGHILGSAIIQLEIREADGDRPTTIVFSGDLGRAHQLAHGLDAQARPGSRRRLRHHSHTFGDDSPGLGFSAIAGWPCAEEDRVRLELGQRGN